MSASLVGSEMCIRDSCVQCAPCTRCMQLVKCCKLAAGRLCSACSVRAVCAVFDHAQITFCARKPRTTA
eukprot:4101646-Alexandrium_andersonii.AAC.1